MEESGIRFCCNTDVGRDTDGGALLKEYDRVVLACGASHPRDIEVPGRDAAGIWFAVDFLKTVTKTLLDSDFAEVPKELAEGKKVLVIGGGDTGNDCVGTAIRLGAESVLQLEMMPKPPECRSDSNPWPEWPKVLKTDYGQEEAAFQFGQDPRKNQTTVKEFLKDQDGKVRAARLVSLVPQPDEKTGRTRMVSVEGSETEIPVDLVLIAAGFLGSEGYVADSFGVQLDGRSNIKTQAGSWQTEDSRIFVAGDMHLGQSLVVRAIAEGTQAAREVDRSLMGYTNL